MIHYSVVFISLFLLSVLHCSISVIGEAWNVPVFVGPEAVVVLGLGCATSVVYIINLKVIWFSGYLFAKTARVIYLISSRSL